MEQVTVNLDLPIPIPGRLRFGLQDHPPVGVAAVAPKYSLPDRPELVPIAHKSSHLDQGVAVDIGLILVLRGPTARRNGAVHPTADRLTISGPLIATTCVGFISTTYGESTWQGGPFSWREVTLRTGTSDI